MALSFLSFYYILNYLLHTMARVTRYPLSSRGFKTHRKTQKAYSVKELQPELHCFRLRALSSLLSVDRY